MILILALLFPPAWPFLLLYLLFGARNADRRTANATERIANVIAPRLVPTTSPAQIVVMLLLIALVSFIAYAAVTTPGGIYHASPSGVYHP